MKRVLSVLVLAWAAATAAWLLRRRADRAALEWAGPRPVDADAVGGTAGDAVVKARVETELFRDGTVPKGDVLVDVVGGVAVVRGEVPPDMVDGVPELISAVEGVVRVDSHLHAPGTPAPPER